MKPILFSTPMVQAILAGTKTMTRRIVKPQPVSDFDSGYVFRGKYQFDIHGLPYTEELPKYAKYQKGDILWVRETWHPKRHNMPTGWKYEYKATAKEDGNPTDEPWKPSRFMPKEAARIFLKVTNVRVERLEDISKKDAIAEGVEKWQQQGYTRYKSYIEPMVGFWDTYNSTGGVHPAIASFRSLWAKINGFDSLNANPWVWVYEFERVDK